MYHSLFKRCLGSLCFETITSQAAMNIHCISLLVCQNKVPQTWWLKWQITFWQFWRLEVCDQGVTGVAFFWGLCMVCRWPSPYTITLVCYLCPNFSYKVTSHIGIGLNSMTTFNLNYLFKETISKDSQILKCLGLGLQHINLEVGRSQFSPFFEWISVFISLR